MGQGEQLERGSCGYLCEDDSPFSDGVGGLPAQEACSSGGTSPFALGTGSKGISVSIFHH